MNCLSPLDSAASIDSALYGGKATMLCRLQREGVPTPAGYALSVDHYHDFLRRTGLDDLLAMELERKDFAEMRWEEIWDVALRIRNHFLRVEWPSDLHTRLHDDLKHAIRGWSAVAVRSSAPGEDGGRQSFAGLHESRIMLRDVAEVMDAIRIVWASLWSDKALLYRQELGLDPGKSAMAVLIQEMMVGDVSGVLFTKAPQDSKVMMIEAVWGLNQALVDGTITPFRCQLDRATGQVTDEQSGGQTAALEPTSHGTEILLLDETKHGRPPVDDSLCKALYQLGLQLEGSIGAPLDIEWTRSAKGLQILQVRPITASLQQSGDDRPWYLSLHRSLDNLETLQKDLESVVLPGMEDAAEQMAAIDLTPLANRELAAEHARRSQILETWLQTYKDKCIPMAHGIRLFGEYYNDHVGPEDPYEFIGLLKSDQLLAVERNRRLLEIAEYLRNDQEVWASVKAGQTIPASHEVHRMLYDLEEEFGGIMWVLENDLELTDWLVKLADQESLNIPVMAERAELEQAFLARLPAEENDLANRMLAVARASYRLRDNDNLYLGKVRAAVAAVEKEISNRLAMGNSLGLEGVVLGRSGHDLLFTRYQATTAGGAPDQRMRQSARQLVGQPAGPGFSSGPARVLDQRSAILDFKPGEVLVCDAIEPNMTFLAPLAAGIIERRGGMLIHGAIIAREYGVPCVTGIPDATQVIRTGDQVSVDGFLGLVTIDRIAD